MRSTIPRSHCFVALLGLAVWIACATRLEGSEPDGVSEREAAAIRGWEFLTQHAVLPSDFDQETFDDLWQSWPKELRQRASKLSLPERRKLAFERYGLTPRSEDTPGTPLQYVVDDAGKWTMNCFACHGGHVYGAPTPGAPNNAYALQTLTEEIRGTKFRLGKGLGRMELGSLVIPLGTTHGTTNAVVFGMGLMNYRDSDLNLINRPPVSFTHHDMDAPPWWTFYKRPYLYIDGFAPKGHRGLMQFTLVPENDASFYRKHEDDFKAVYAYISSLRAPKYRAPIDHQLAQQGLHLFANHCSECHGTYHPAEDDLDTYPNRMIPIGEIGTDPVRHEALTVAGRTKYAKSWFSRGKDTDGVETIVDPAGYVAPPLDGIWASAPYFHNGSVPTLWHVLHPSERPKIWRRTEVAIDAQKIGLRVESVERVPLENPDVAVRRTHFDTRRRGKSASGHDYPDRLSEDEKAAVLEYLKTL